MIGYILTLCFALYAIFYLEGKRENVLIPEIIFNNKKQKIMNTKKVEEAIVLNKFTALFSKVNTKQWGIIAILGFALLVYCTNKSDKVPVEAVIELPKQVDTLSLIMEYHLPKTFFDPIAYKSIDPNKFLNDRNYRDSVIENIFVTLDFNEMKIAIEETIRNEVKQELLNKLN